MRRKYNYVRYVWWSEVDIDDLSEELSREFEIKHLPNPISPFYEFSLYKEARREILVKADTLKAYISMFRAVLFQREKAPFTPNDMELRRRLLDIYPRDRPSPFPWAFNDEEPFEVAEK